VPRLPAAPGWSPIDLVYVYISAEECLLASIAAFAWLSLAIGLIVLAPVWARPGIDDVVDGRPPLREFYMPNRFVIIP